MFTTSIFITCAMNYYTKVNEKYKKMHKLLSAFNISAAGIMICLFILHFYLRFFFMWHVYISSFLLTQMFSSILWLFFFFFSAKIEPFLVLF